MRVDLPSSTEPQVMKRSRLLRSCALEAGADVAHAPGRDRRAIRSIPPASSLSIEPAASWSMTRPWRSEVVVESISSMTSSTVSAFALDGTGQRIAAEGAEAHLLHRRPFARLQRQPLVVHHDERAVALDHRPFGGEVQRHDGDVLQLDVLPDVELGPVRQRKHADALAGALARVVERPELGPLAASGPSGAAPSGTRRCAPWRGSSPHRGARRRRRRRSRDLSSACFSACGLHHVGVEARAVRERIDSVRQTLLVDVHDELEARASRAIRVAEFVHVAELPGGVDVQQRKRRRRPGRTP